MPASRQVDRADRWPVLTAYDGDHLLRVAMPIGGIGAGTVSLGGRGDLRDWEVGNSPAKKWTPWHCFFALRTKTKRGVVARALEGPIDPVLYEGAFGVESPNHQLPRFRDARFLAAYPLGQVELSDSDVPVKARLEAFNPMIPGDVDASGAPVAVLRWVLTNPGSEPVDASICGNLENFIGCDANAREAKGNVNEWRERDGLRGVFLRSDGVAPTSERWGTLALATTATSGLSHRANWVAANGPWGDPWLDWWDDFVGDGALDDRPPGAELPRASLCARVRVPARGEARVTFLIGWHFPNRMTWTRAPKPKEGEAAPCCPAGAACPDPDRIGNWYATRWRDAWDAAAWMARELQRLEERTVAFVRSFCAADLPHAVKEAALFNLSTLRTQTTFRAENGEFYGWEGCGDRSGCCHGTCTHVWNYEHATGFVFPQIGRSMRETELLWMTRDDGRMSFRINLPVARATEWSLAAADGQMGALMRLHREWKLSGDFAWLRRLWPRARKALEFCWVPGGWDGDQDGVMEGCQHNTMDVEYFGPNPQMGLWYLGALRACADMARALGEADFAARCDDLATRGARWIDAHLFNGEYYEHEVRGMRAADIAPGTRHDVMDHGARDTMEPDLQLGPGCLVDQLVGQFTAHVCGLGRLVDAKKLRATNAALMKHNFRLMRGHFNHMRTFALGEERALIMASYPHGRRPKRPFPYFNEVMTGFEYAAAIEMLYEGQVADGLRCIAAIRERYDGHRRNPFDEAECGHHYARAMASWAAILALTGFRYDGTTGELRFARARGKARWFWCVGSAWGEIEQRAGVAALSVLHGELRVARVAIGDAPAISVDRTITAGERVALRPGGQARKR